MTVDVWMDGSGIRIGGYIFSFALNKWIKWRPWRAYASASEEKGVELSGFSIEETDECSVCNVQTVPIYKIVSTEHSSSWSSRQRRSDYRHWCIRIDLSEFRAQEELQAKRNACQSQSPGTWWSWLFWGFQSSYHPDMSMRTACQLRATRPRALSTVELPMVECPEIALMSRNLWKVKDIC